MRSRRVFIVLISLLWSGSAHADANVILFGGYAASRAQMDCWEKGARQNPAFQGYFFRGIPYPSKSANVSTAVNDGASVIRKLADEINRNRGTRYIIAGHSSGAALANRTAEMVKDPSRIVLVDLDGYPASASLQQKVQTTCWYAVNSRTGLPSRNAASMKQCVRSAFHSNTTCNTDWCLHFALVNTKAPANLGSDFKKNGYNGCGTNLDWLHQNQ